MLLAGLQEAYSPHAMDAQPMQHASLQAAMVSHAMNAEPMRCAGLAVQTKLLDAVRSVMLTLSQGSAVCSSNSTQEEASETASTGTVWLLLRRDSTSCPPCALMAKHHGGIHVEVCNLATLPVCRQGATMGAKHLPPEVLLQLVGRRGGGASGRVSAGSFECTLSSSWKAYSGHLSHRYHMLTPLHGLCLQTAHVTAFGSRTQTQLRHEAWTSALLMHRVHAQGQA